MNGDNRIPVVAIPFIIDGNVGPTVGTNGDGFPGASVVHFVSGNDIAILTSWKTSGHILI